MSPPRAAPRLSALLLLLAGGVLSPVGASAETVEICHAPPGDPEARRVIRVSPSAAERHLERHPDTPYLGVEQCNGADDDCDGRIDELFPSLGHACSEGLGVCAAAGAIACDPLDESRVHCDAQPLPPLEPRGERTCTGGLDEDCDGLVDGEDPDCGFDLGRQLPSLVDLPITIDCCDVSGPECVGRDYCRLVEEPINPCPLEDGEEVVSCLEFQAFPEQNACWSDLDADVSVTNPELIAVLESAPVVVGRESVWVDNGDKIPFVRRMRDRMYGQGAYLGDPAGVDRYPEVPGIDSWVVRLPVVECQDFAHCAGSSSKELVGALCFEIREITGAPDHRVKGRFLCPDTDDPLDRHLLEECALGPDFAD